MNTQTEEPVIDINGEPWEQSYLDEMFSKEQQPVLLNLTAEQQQDWLDCYTSYEDMKAYLENPNTPEAVKAVMSLKGWAEYHEEQTAQAAQAAPPAATA